jgi:hypothetical protein
MAAIMNEIPRWEIRAARMVKQTRQYLSQVSLMNHTQPTAGGGEGCSAWRSVRRPEGAAYLLM